MTEKTLPFYTIKNLTIRTLKIMFTKSIDEITSKDSVQSHISNEFAREVKRIEADPDRGGTLKSPLADDPILTDILPIGAEDIHHPDTRQFIANNWKRFAQTMDQRGHDERLAFLRNLVSEWEENYRRKWNASRTSGPMIDILHLAARSGLTKWLSRHPTPTTNEMGGFYARLVEYSAAINDTVNEVSPHLAFAAHRVANVLPNDIVRVDNAGDGLIAVFLGDHQNVHFSEGGLLRRAIFNQLFPVKRIISEGPGSLQGKSFDVTFTENRERISPQILLAIGVSPGGRLVIYGDKDWHRMSANVIQALSKHGTAQQFVASLPPTVDEASREMYAELFDRWKGLGKKISGNFLFKAEQTKYGSEGGAIIVIDNIPGTETNSEVLNMGNTQARPISDYVSSFDKVRNTRTGTSKEMMEHARIQADVKRRHEQAKVRRKAAAERAVNQDGAKIFRDFPEIELKVKTIGRKAIAGNLIPKGTQYDTIEELAVIADVARNPAMPTIQTLLVSDGQVQASVLGGIRSGEDASVTAEEVGMLVPDTEAAGHDVITVVNRPSGDTTITKSDKRLAWELAKKYDGFQYLLIKNGDTYSAIIIKRDAEGKPVDEDIRQNVAILRGEGRATPQVEHPSWAPDIDQRGADALVESIRQDFEQIHSQHIDVLSEIVDLDDNWAVLALMNQDGTLTDMVEIPNSFDLDLDGVQTAINKAFSLYGGVDAYLFLASANHITENPDFFENTSWGQYLSNNPNIRGHMLVGGGIHHLANRVKSYDIAPRDGSFREMARQVSPNLPADLVNNLAILIDRTALGGQSGNFWAEAKAMFVESLGRDMTRTQPLTEAEEKELRMLLNMAMSRLIQKFDIRPDIVDANTAKEMFRILMEMSSEWQTKSTMPLNGPGDAITAEHAFLLHYLAGVAEGDVVAIPDAGSGMLAGFANQRAKTVLTEPDPVRRKQLQDVLGVRYINDAASADLAGYWQSHPNLQAIRPNVVLLDSLSEETFWQQLNQALHTVDVGGRVVAHLNLPMVENEDGEIVVDPAFDNMRSQNINAIKQYYQLRMSCQHNGRYIIVVDRVEQPNPNLGSVSKIYEDVETLLKDAEGVRDTRSDIQPTEQEMMPDKVVDTTAGTQETPQTQEVDSQTEVEEQEKHTKPIDVSQAAHRKFHIRQICKERNITTLVHFTRIENLQNILQQGLLGRSLLEARGQDFLFNDEDRADSNKEAVCLSISFPNYQMFYSIREEKKETQEANDSQWVILLLDAKVLWELDCAFCQDNAARRAVSSIPLKDRRKPEALKGVFGDFYNIRHQDLQIPDPYLKHPKDAYPTHPQAEVLVFDSVPVQFIKAIHFWDETTLEKCRSSYAENYSQMLSVNQQYFTYRTDYEVWRRANFNSEGIPLSYFNSDNDDDEIDRASDLNEDDIPF